jgi:UDP-N-acetylglucosamine--N-acetylmuramyl-(pentapeptide) pyrophosphoryl-undecaprenol N-acetylglucosamine transferase
MTRVRLVGNPVRQQVLDAVTAYQPPDAAHVFNLLVFGGSQGAQYFSQVMPQVVAELAERADQAAADRAAMQARGH